MFLLFSLVFQWKIRNFAVEKETIMRQLLQLLSVMFCIGAWAADADTLKTVCYCFNEPLGSEWTYVHEPVRENYVTRDGLLRLYGSATSFKDDVQPTFAALSPTVLGGFPAESADSVDYTMTMKIVHSDLLDGDEVGLAVYQAPMGYAQCCLHNLRGDRRIRVRLLLKYLSFMISDRSVGVPSEIWIRLEARNGMYRFSYSTNGQRYVALESVDRSLLRPVVVGQGNGILVGPYSFVGSPKLQAGRSFGDIDELEITYWK